jgi:hypothetical protein
MLLRYEQFVTAQTHSRVAITKTDIDSKGNIHIFDSSSDEVVPPKAGEQVACSSPKIAQDRRTVGWLEDYPNCCTSYPISLGLSIYRNEKVIQHIQPEDNLAIWDWQFVKGGRQVAFWTGPVHGDFKPHFWLYDVGNERWRAKWNGHLDEKPPSWTAGLRE